VNRPNLNRFSRSKFSHPQTEQKLLFGGTKRLVPFSILGAQNLKKGNALSRNPARLHQKIGQNLPRFADLVNHL
jgi:hypothetical protein